MNIKESIIEVFTEEFNSISDRISIIKIEKNDTKELPAESYRPGTYVFWNGDKVIKVGRSLANSKKRALQHIQDNTRNAEFEMRSLREKDNWGIILFNTPDIADMHWVAAIEIYLEKSLNPLIKSGRIG